MRGQRPSEATTLEMARTRAPGGGDSVKITPFAVEQWMSAHENRAAYNLAETCAESFSLREFLELCGKGPDFVDHLLDAKFTYGEVLGSEALRREMARSYPSEDPEEILITHGAIEANYLVFHALISPGDKVVVTFPAYQQLYQVPESLGARVERWVLAFETGFSPNFDRLAELVDDNTRLLVINNPHNPTGTVFTRADLERISSIVSRVGAKILCDEVYHGFFWTGEVPTMAAVNDGAVITGSLSKNAALAGLRIGWIRAPREILHDCRLHQDYITIGPPILSDRLALVAVQNREALFSRNLQLVGENRLALTEWVNQEPHIRWVSPQGGTTALLKYDFDISSRHLCNHLISEKSVLLVPGDCFEMEGFVRIGYGCASSTLERGLALISDYFRRL